MGLQVLTGRAGAGKSTAIMRLIGQAKGKRILLVPEQFTLQSEIEITKNLHLPGFMDVEVLSPSRLLQRVLKETGFAGYTLLDERGQSMALRAAMLDAGKELAYYGGYASRSGFLENMLSLFNQLRTQGTQELTLHLFADTLKEEGLRRKYYDLALLFEKYEEILRGHYLDHSDGVLFFLQRCASSRLLQDASIFVDGFDVLPVRTLELLLALVKVCRQVTVAFTLCDPKDEDREVFSSVFRSVGDLLSMAEEAQLPYRDTYLKRKPFKRGMLSHLEKELFKLHPRAYEPIEEGQTPSVRLFSARHPQEEAAFVSGEILHLVSHGYRLKEIAVVTGSLPRYGRLVQAELRLRGLSAFLDDRLTADLHPVCVYVLSSLQAFCHGYRREEMLKVMQSGFSPLTMEEADRFGNFVVMNRLSGRAFTRPITKGVGTEDFEGMEKLRKTLLAPFQAFENLPAVCPVARIAEAIYAYLTFSDGWNRLNAQMEEDAFYEDAYARDRAMQERAQAWDELMQVLSQSVEIMKEREISLADYASLLKTGLSQVQLGVLPSAPDAVLVGDLHRAKLGSGIRALFVTGLNADVLPKAYDENPLLPDQEKESLSAFCKEKGLKYFSLGDAAFSRSIEELAIYSAFTTPTDLLLLSSSLRDLEGTPLRKSELCRKLQLLFPQLEEEMLPEDSPLLFAGNRQALASQARLSYEKYREGKVVSPVWLGILRYFSDQETGLLPYPASRESIPPLSVPHLFSTDQMSVSRLEEYARCPFRYFVSYGLRPVKTEERLLDAMDIGTLFHEALQEFSVKLAQTSEITQEICDQICESVSKPLLDKMFSSLPEGSQTGKMKAVLSQAQYSIRRACRVLGRQSAQSQFKLFGVELSFGLGGFPPILLEGADGQRVYLRGRIDRVDFFENEQGRYVRVIDNKSGVPSLDIEDMQKGLRLQLFLYLSAVSTLLQGKPAGAFYFHVQDVLLDWEEVGNLVEEKLAEKLKLRGLVLRDVEIVEAMGMDTLQGVKLKKDGDFSAASPVIEQTGMEQLLKQAQNVALRLTKEMEAGLMPIAPQRDHKRNLPCNYCDFAAICGIQVQRKKEQA